MKIVKCVSNINGFTVGGSYVAYGDVEYKDIVLYDCLILVDDNDVERRFCDEEEKRCFVDSETV